MSPDDLAKYSQALVTPAIAVFGGFIAWRQWRTAHDKLKLELFDRRFGIVKHYADFVDSANAAMREDRENDLIAMDVFDLEAKIGHSRFLFGDDVNTALDRFVQIFKRRQHYWKTIASLRRSDHEKAVKMHNDLVERDRENARQLYETTAEIMSAFQRYLSFGHLHGAPSRQLWDELVVIAKQVAEWVKEKGIE